MVGLVRVAGLRERDAQLGCRGRMKSGGTGNDDAVACLLGGLHGAPIPMTRSDYPTTGLASSSMAFLAASLGARPSSM